MEFQIKIEYKQADLERLKEFPARARRGMETGLGKAVKFVEAEVKKSFGQGGTPKIKTGTLRRSITSGVDKVPVLLGWVGTNVSYAGIQEFGGTIRAKNSKYLTFQVNKHWVKVKEVVIPARPYLRPAVMNNMDKIADLIMYDIIQALEANK
jgi:phage gpG-like protein